MTASEVLREACQIAGVSQAEVARRIGQDHKRFNQKLIAGTIDTYEFMKALKTINVDLYYTQKENRKRFDANIIPSRIQDENPELCGTGTFLKVVASLGLDVNIVSMQPKYPHHGRRVKGMADRVKYDTEESIAVANTFYEDGEHEYDQNGMAYELYIDPDGRYFMAEYTEDGENDRVKSIPGVVAAAFIEKYGTEIEKQKQ